ncbi:MAG: extracellular solute-binding protein family 5 [Frankiales bacterium]|nr:extracellular solute-binding protein family 5 [Frankiales bacterium]
MTTRGTTAKLFSAALAIALAAACGGSSSPSTGSTSTGKAKVGGSITYGADQEPTGFNQLTSKDSGTSVVNVMEGVLPSVFRTHPDFTVQLDKDLMTSAELTSEKPETVTYKIKPEAKWSDGVPVDASDFELLWKAQNGTDKKFDVASTTGYEDIKSVTGSDNGKTVTVVFKNVFADWRSLFSALLPAHLVNKGAKGVEETWNNGFNSNMPVSAGPFKFGTYKKTDSLTLVRNDAYWGKKANLDSVIFRFLPESTTQPDALKNGEVQLIYPQPQLDLVAQVKAIPGVVSETNFGLTFEHLDFNVKTPGLDDIAVRKAIATGLDTDALLKRTVGQFSDKAQILGNHIYVNSQKEYVDNSGSFAKGDIPGAQKILTDAGYTKGADGIFAKGGKKLSFRFSTTAGNALRETQGELFKAQMKLVGIDIRIDNSTSQVLFGERLPGHNFDIADFAWVATPFATSNKSIYSTGAGQNYGQFSNADVDKMFNEANATLDDKQRTDKFNAIDKLLWDNVATIALYQKPTFIAYSDKYVNIGDNASSEGPFWNVGEWGLKA